jgi:HlyD family secretion protein
MRMTSVAVTGLFAALLLAPPVWAQHGPASVITARAELRSLPATQTLVGSVEPLTITVLGTEVAGLVKDVPARQGDRVEKDALICKLNDDILSLQLQQEKAKLSNLEARLQELLNGTRKEELERLRAQHEAAAAVAERWAFELERVKRLQGGDFANQKEYQDALAQKVSAEKEEEAAKAALDEGLAGPREEVIAQARHAVAEQAAVVDRVKTEIAKTEIRAPFTGYVVRRFAEVGNWLAVGGNVVELADLSTVLVRIDVPEQAIPYADVGSRASVLIDALNERFGGRIKHIIPQADPAARTFPVEIEVPNPDARLKAGMFARATVVTGPEKQMVAVPKDAISQQMGASYVAVVRPGQGGQMMAYPTPVSVGLDISDWIAITSGNIPEGTEVVVRGNEMITLMMAPAPVQVVKEPGASEDSSNDKAAPAAQTKPRSTAGS